MSHISAAVARMALLRKHAMGEPLPQDPAQAEPAMDPAQAAIEQEQAEVDAAQKELNMARQKAKLAKQNFELQRDELNTEKSKAALETEAEEFQNEQQQAEAAKAEAEAAAMQQQAQPDPANQMQMAAMEQAQMAKTASRHSPYYFGIVDRHSMHMFRPRLMKLAEGGYDIGGWVDAASQKANEAIDKGWASGKNYFKGVLNRAKKRIAGSMGSVGTSPGTPVTSKPRARKTGSNVDPTQAINKKVAPKPQQQPMKTTTPGGRRGNWHTKRRQGGVVIHNIGGVKPSTYDRITRKQPVVFSNEGTSYNDIVNRRADRMRRIHAGNAARNAANRAYDKNWAERRMKYGGNMAGAHAAAGAAKRGTQAQIEAVRAGMRPKETAAQIENRLRRS